MTHSPAQEVRSPAPSRAAVRGMCAAALLAGALSLGPLFGAVVNSVAIEVSIGRAAHLPVPEFLPVALDALGGLALLVLAALQPAQALRIWCWLIVLAVLMAAMAAGGAHAVFPVDERGELVLPPPVAFAVSAIPAASAAATLHLLLLLAGRLLELVRTLGAHPAPPDVTAQPGVSEDLADAEHPKVLSALQARRGYRTVMTATGWPRTRAQAALEAARSAAHAAQLPSTELATLRTSTTTAQPNGQTRREELCR